MYLEISQSSFSYSLTFLYVLIAEKSLILSFFLQFFILKFIANFCPA